MDACINTFFATGTAVFAAYSYQTMNKVAEATQKLNECITNLSTQVFDESISNMTCDHLNDELYQKSIEEYAAVGTLLFLTIGGIALCCIKPHR